MIDQYWKTIESVLQRELPDVHRTLRPGATEEQIKSIERTIGKVLPPSFRESLAIHDGQDDPTRLLPLFNYNSFSSCSEIIADWEMMQENFPNNDIIDWLEPDKIQNRIWDSGWIKFTESEGDGYAVDLHPAHNGVLGQVFYLAHDDNPTQRVIQAV